MEVSVPLIPHKMNEKKVGKKKIKYNSVGEIIEIEEFSTSAVNEEPINASLSTTSVFLGVPPTTPASNFSFNFKAHPLIYPLPNLNTLKIPYIRDVGIKTCIDILSDHFSCPDYKLSAIQFWFLDVITDCLWQLQDEFDFPEHHQKIIVEWILYIFDLIRDPQKNLSRREFFEIFNEALVIADEQVQTGCEILPLPNHLFSFFETEEEEQISFRFSSQTEQSSSVSLASGGESYIGIGNIDENSEIFQIPQLQKQCRKKNKCRKKINEINSLSKESLCGCEESVDFYQPDMNTPSRFLSSPSSESLISDEINLSPVISKKLVWEESTPSLHSSEICDDHVSKKNPTLISSSNITTADDLRNYLNNACDEEIEEIETKIMINGCALTFIKNFVYDYFNDSFQYAIIKLAFMNYFTTVTQNVNTEWKIPKVLKEEIKIPKPKKQKKKKPKKPKKPRAKTKSKKNKKSKPKKKGSKKSKKSSKSKKKPLTKEEKAELARLKREQEKLEEEMRIAEENRRLLFPLKDATNDEFFKSIFDHWVKPKVKSKKNKKKNKKKKK